MRTRRFLVGLMPAALPATAVGGGEKGSGLILSDRSNLAAAAMTANRGPGTGARRQP